MAVLAEKIYTNAVPIQSVRRDDFRLEYSKQKAKDWQEYTLELLKKIDAVGLVKKHLGSVAENLNSIKLPHKISTHRITYAFSHVDGTDEKADFRITGLKVPLRAADNQKTAYIFIGIKSRGENDMQDLKIGREVGVFLLEENEGKRHVTYGKTNRQLPLYISNNPTKVSSLLAENISRSISIELSQIGLDYAAKLS